jgi:hypothetical protein
MADDDVIGERASMDDRVTLVEALHTIAVESEEADIVRIAMSALTGTDIGQAYLRTNPIKY